MNEKCKFTKSETRQVDVKNKISQFGDIYDMLW